MTAATNRLGLAGRLAALFIGSKLTPLLLAGAVALGVVATLLLPREEEPQIVVPTVDVFVELPGATAREVEARVSSPLERVLHALPAVEHVYSTSSPGRSLLIVRFLVGTDEDHAILAVRDALRAHPDAISPDAGPPLVRPRSIDDVPVLSVTLASETSTSLELRRLAEEVRRRVSQVDGVSAVDVIGGTPREARVLLDPERLAARNLSPTAVADALSARNRRLPSGAMAADNHEILIETGAFLTDADAIGATVIGGHEGGPVYVRDVAEVVDGGGEPSSYVRFGRGAGDAGGANAGAVDAITVAIAKRPGTNAVDVVAQSLAVIDALEGSVLPADVEVVVTRDHGASASDKSNELLFHMGVAVFGVALLILFALGRRESLVVLLAIPATLALTLTVFFLYGYTLNRITLFALIFSIGILVDDAIVVVENIARHARQSREGRSLREIAIRATEEVGNPTILATAAVVAAILPMAFVGGMMGPYMRPIPVGASAAMGFSLLVAFTVTPWAAAKLLPRAGGSHAQSSAEGWTTRLYRRAMTRLIARPGLRWAFLGGTGTLLLGAMSLVAVGAVEVKMLPFDNKSEFQVMVDMPEGTTLEQTARVTQAVADVVAEQPEVLHYQSYAGTAGPVTFSGLVRHYDLRRGSHVADVVVDLAPRDERDAQSHAVAGRVRRLLAPVAERFGARLQIAEVPPGPPVLQTLVAEVYGPTEDGRLAVADAVRREMDRLDGVVDVDWMAEEPQSRRRVVVDEEKAALAGLSTAQVARELRLLLTGEEVGRLHDGRERDDVPVMVQLPRAQRDLDRLLSVRLVGAAGRSVALGELVRVVDGRTERSLYHKDLRPVVYVTGDVGGAIESPAYAMLPLRDAVVRVGEQRGHRIEQLFTESAPPADVYAVRWDGEWQITVEVFRDLGLAFAAVLGLIYLLVVAWFRSYAVPFVIMSAIPFSLVGILPAHALFGAFFTATSMIGFIAGAGIVVRNSIILVDFIELRRRQGMSLAEAVVDAGAVRFRPMALTAAAVIVGASVILTDPVFQGLALSLMAGEVASLLLSRVAVPVLYFMLERTPRPEPAIDGASSTAAGWAPLAR